MPLIDVVQNLQAALEASLYVSPIDHGLTEPELIEVGRRLGFRDGEIGDAIPQVTQQYFGRRDERLQLGPHHWYASGFFIFREEPDLRNVDAFDFVMAQLNSLARDHGASRARIERTILVNRGPPNIPVRDIQVAISLMVVTDQLIEEEGILRFNHPESGERPLPSASMHEARQQPAPKKLRTVVMPHVKDVINRRTDGRPKNADPFEAFAEQLQGLGYGYLNLWWQQTTTELARTEPMASPLAALVLAAALVEGALTLVVKRARDLNLGVFASKDFDRPPTQWRIDDLVESAAKGMDDAILSSQERSRAELLVRTRQRIHAGRMLSSVPQSVPDLRPEEAQEAKAIAQLVVRRVVDWLAKHPAA